ncbi:hypothetical protein QBC46DRAFT_165474 [Diplogelasinospora grovesii]|uniref:Short chain dehydrogenase/reductase n=1 Tax=Diplogelasinospora grovesii TaxID=303347 RepID=A0AAN6S8K8_9PEZI|nr:hypothetical protein QBC46DRAFT_165474 [Diplogelasinospora grovesii]
MPASDVFQPGNTAVITGGASGIGLSLAKKCVDSGMKVLAADFDEELLARMKSEIGGDSNVVIITYKMDVGKLEDWAGLKDTVDDVFGGKINLLSLNAGTMVKCSWSDAQSFHKILNTNLFGVINGITTFFPLLQAPSTTTTHSTAVVITGSKQGITNPPGNPAYNASKSAVKTLAEHLSWDLRGNANVSVHLLVPGWTFTGLSGNRPGSPSREKPAGAWEPSQVVEYMVGKMKEDKFYIVCPDNDVTEEVDQKRMLWAAGDVVYGRPPLTRWREDWKDKAKEGVDQQQV